LAVLVGGLATGCAAGQPPDNRASAAQAVHALQSAGTATLKLDIKLPDGPNGVELAGAQRRRYTPPAGSDTEFTVSAIGNPGRGTTDAEVITAGNTVYRKGFSPRPGKAWEKVADPGTPAPTRGAPDPTGSTAALFDPVTYLELASGQGDVSDAGTEVVDGISTHAYRVACVFTPEPGPVCHLRDLGPIADALPANGTLFIEYWLDADSRPRKLTVSGVLDDQHGQPPVRIDITMTLGAFGDPVDITPPPPAETMTCQQSGTGIHCP
jgi:hypothetical protein